MYHIFYVVGEDIVKEETGVFKKGNRKDENVLHPGKFYCAMTWIFV